ncbi:hypothetical protein X945_6017 [Burkholderia pseudomallei ABCPW 107]|nr:hypothetical protein X945_6017 [Burkholderia pseudomallei ABCPW 107]
MGVVRRLLPGNYAERTLRRWRSRGTVSRLIFQYFVSITPLPPNLLIRPFPTRYTIDQTSLFLMGLTKRFLCTNL